VRSLAALLAAVAMVAAGCGSDRLSKQEYLQRLQTLDSGANARVSTLFLAVVVEDPQLDRAACVKRTRELHRRLEEVLDAVDKLRAPGDVEGLQDEFVDAARESAATVSRAADDVERGALSCGRPMNARIYGLASTERARRVLDELGRKGYRIELNS
jgi:hypothetical protein